MTRRLALLVADATNRDHLEATAEGAAGDHVGGCELAFPVAKAVKADVALIAYNGAVEFVARIDGHKRADNVRRVFVLRSVTALHRRLPVDRIGGVLTKAQRAPLYEPGPFTQRAAAAVLGLLVQHEPVLGPVLDEMFITPLSDLTPARRARLAQERDAVASLGAFTGFPDLLPADGLLTPDDTGQIGRRPTFIPHTVPQHRRRNRVPLEDSMIEHDANTVLGWTPGESDTLGKRVYHDGNERTLEVLSVNRWNVETELGPDLIYYHVQRRSLVLVQYKRMTEENGRWCYRADDHFRKQLRAMRRLDEKCSKTGADGQFRLLATPSFVKICKLETLDISSLSMVSGMCMPRGQAEAHLSRPGAPNTFGYEEVPDYMTSTLFAQLVAYGYVGTSGASTDFVLGAIDAALNRNGSAAVGIFSDNSGKRPGWKSSR